MFLLWRRRLHPPPHYHHHSAGQRALEHGSASMRPVAPLNVAFCWLPPQPVPNPGILRPLLQVPDSVRQGVARLGEFVRLPTDGEQEQAQQ